MKIIVSIAGEDIEIVTRFTPLCETTIKERLIIWNKDSQHMRLGTKNVNPWKTGKPCKCLSLLPGKILQYICKESFFCSQL